MSSQYDRGFASTLRSFGSFEASSAKALSDVSDRSQKTGYYNQRMKVEMGTAHPTAAYCNHALKNSLLPKPSHLQSVELLLQANHERIQLEHLMVRKLLLGFQVRLL